MVKIYKKKKLRVLLRFFSVLFLGLFLIFSVIHLYLGQTLRAVEDQYIEETAILYVKNINRKIQSINQEFLMLANNLRNILPGIPQNISPRDGGYYDVLFMASDLVGSLKTRYPELKQSFLYWPASDLLAFSTGLSFASTNDFGITGQGKQRLRQPKDSKIVFDTGSGADDPEKGFYSGCLFKVTGENIKTVSATIDRGAVYRTKTVKDTSADRDEWVRTMYQGTNPAIDGADRIMVWGSDEMHMYADLCWKLDNGFTDEYDPDVSYGLWLPSRQEDADDDLQDSRHKSVDGFEGAKLTVTITFNDGSEQTRSMTLHTGKLGVEYKDDTSGPSLTGEVLTDAQAEEQGYLYGVYGELD